MNPIAIAGPAVEPVPLDDMRAFLRLDDAAEDALVETLVAAARRAVEAACGRVLIAQSWRLALDRWPAGGVVALPLSPLIAIEEIRVVDAAGATAVLAPALYRFDAAADPPRLLVEAAAPQPGRAPHGIAVDVRVGYGAAPEDVPAPLRQAVRLLAAHWFEHRGDDAAPPPDIGALVAPFRRARL
jgi:uncharacterized phiE125 gp8 family phage protein